MLQEVVRVEGRVQSVATDERVGIDGTDPLGHADAQAQCRVHGHGDADEPGSGGLDVVKDVHGNIEDFGREPSALEKADGARGAKRLVAQFVTRDQQNRTGSA